MLQGEKKRKDKDNKRFSPFFFTSLNYDSTSLVTYLKI